MLLRCFRSCSVHRAWQLEVLVVLSRFMQVLVVRLLQTGLQVLVATLCLMLVLLVPQRPVVQRTLLARLLSEHPRSRLRSAAAAR